MNPASLTKKRKQTGIRLSQVAQEQLAQLREWWGEQTTQAIERSIERAYVQEKREREGKQ